MTKIEDIGWNVELPHISNQTTSICRIQPDFYVFSESRRIVIARGFGVADGFHDGIRSQNLFLDLRFGLRSADGGEIPHGVFGRNGLSGARLTGNDDRLITIESTLRQNEI